MKVQFTDKIKLLATALILFAFAATASATALLPNAKQNFFNVDGTPCVGCSVYFYIPSTTTPKNTWQDASQSVLNSNPVIVDSAGQAIIYGAGSYRQILKDALGNVIWDKTTSDLSVSGTTEYVGTSGGSANSQTVSSSTFTASDGQSLAFRAGFTNTSSLNLIVSGGSPIAVREDTATQGPGPITLTGGEVHAGNWVLVWYDATGGFFHLVTNANSAFLNLNNTMTGNNTFTGTNVLSGPSTLSNNQVSNFNGYTSFEEQTLTVTTGTVAWDMSLSPDAIVTSSSALTFAAPTNLVTGQRGKLRINNSGGSAIALTWNAAYSFLAQTGSLVSGIPPGSTYFDYWVSGGVVYISRTPLNGPLNYSATATTTSGNSASVAVPIWAKRISVLINGISTNGTNAIGFTIGNGSGESTGYVSACSILTGTTPSSSSSAGTFILLGTTASSPRIGYMQLVNVTGNTWAAIYNVQNNASNSNCNGTKTTAAAVNILSISTSDTFNGGSFTVSAE